MAPQTRAGKRLKTKETTTPQTAGAGKEKGRKRQTTKKTTTTYKNTRDSTTDDEEGGLDGNVGGRGRGRDEDRARPLVSSGSQFISNLDIVQDLKVVIETEREKEMHRETSPYVREHRVTASIRRQDGLMVRFHTNVDSTVDMVRAIREMDAGYDDIVPMVQDLGTDTIVTTPHDSQVEASSSLLDTLRQCANEDQSLVNSAVQGEIWHTREGFDVEAEENHLPLSSIQRPVITPSSTTSPRWQAATPSSTCPPTDLNVPPLMMPSSTPLPPPTAFPQEVPRHPCPPPVRRRKARAAQDAPPRPGRRGRPVLPPVAPPPPPEPEVDRDQLKDWMPGGPRLPTVLPSCATHIAHYIWRAAPPEMIRHELRCHTRRLEFADLHHHIVDGPGTWWSIAQRSGITELGSLEYGHVDHILIAAFVERWYPETNSFHFPWGEMTITLHDVAMIMGLPIEGDEMSPQMQDDALRVRICQMFNFSMDQMYAYSNHGGITCVEVVEYLQDMIRTGQRSQEDIASAYLFLLVGCTIFVDRSTNRVKHKYMQFVLDHDKTEKFAWATGVLALLYRNLGEASRAQVAGMGGCPRLLQAWIWRYFPAFAGRMSLRPTNLADRRAAAADDPGPIPIQDPGRLRLIRQALDTVRAEEVVWTPWASQRLNFRTGYRLSRYNGLLRCLSVVEPYMPIRVLRQFGLRQVVPPNPIEPQVVKRTLKVGGYKVEFLGSNYPRWDNRDNLLFDIDAFRTCTFPWDYEDGYIEYHQSITHPLVDPSSQPHGLPGDGLRVPRSFVVDMITRHNITIGEVRTWLEDDKINEAERKRLCRILEILVDDPYPMPPSPRIYRNSQH